MAGNLNAPWHRGVVVQAGKMGSRLVGAGTETTGRSIACSPGTDAGLHEEAIPVVGIEPLLGQVDLDAFPD